jgi:hypothetical protein
MSARADHPGVRKAVFARELLRMGPWTTAAALKQAHRRGVLQEGRHWDWLGSQRVYYPERIFPGLNDENGEDDGSKTTTAATVAQRLRRVLAEIGSRPPPA